MDYTKDFLEEKAQKKQQEVNKANIAMVGPLFPGYDKNTHLALKHVPSDIRLDRTETSTGITKLSTKKNLDTVIYNAHGHNNLYLTNSHRIGLSSDPNKASLDTIIEGQAQNENILWNFVFACFSGQLQNDMINNPQTAAKLKDGSIIFSFSDARYPTLITLNRDMIDSIAAIRSRHETITPEYIEELVHAISQYPETIRIAAKLDGAILHARNAPLDVMRLPYRGGRDVTHVMNKTYDTLVNFFNTALYGSNPVITPRPRQARFSHEQHVKYRHDALAIAVIRNDAQAVHAIINAGGINPNYTLKPGTNLLDLALTNIQPNPHMIGILLQSGAAVSSNHLKYALEGQYKYYPAILDNLLRHSDPSLVHTPLKNNKTLLYTAIESNNVNAIATLLRHGTYKSLNQRDVKLAIHTSQRDIVKLFLDYAIEHNDIQTFHSILHSKLVHPDDMLRPNPYQTPLSIAVGANNPRMVKDLLHYRGNIPLTQVDVNTILFSPNTNIIATYVDHIITTGNNQALSYVLNSGRFNPHYPLNLYNGENALHHAIRYNNTTAVGLLIQAGTKVDTRALELSSRLGNKALHHYIYTQAYYQQGNGHWQQTVTTTSPSHTMQRY